jgi:hypothetical protein
MATIPIAQAIKTIRDEIATAVRDGQNEEIKFDLGAIELEFQVEISEEKGGSGGASAGFNVGVVALELSGEGNLQRSKSTTHTVKLTLNPKTAQKGPIEIAQKGATPPR